MYSESLPSCTFMLLHQCYAGIYGYKSLNTWHMPLSVICEIPLRPDFFFYVLSQNPYTCQQLRYWLAASFRLRKLNDPFLPLPKA